MQATPTYAEFFAGGGMVHAALRNRWSCVLANDIDPMKCDAYTANWGGDHLWRGDVAELPDQLLRQPVDMYWASSPCQDFSLAGKGLGLRGTRSGIFDCWTQKITRALKAGYAPRVIAFENVTGLVSRNKGKDFLHVINTLMSLGYVVGALEIDAKFFLPQSRPRLFVIGLRKDLGSQDMRTAQPNGPFHSGKLIEFVQRAAPSFAGPWAWWKHDTPATPSWSLVDLVDLDSEQPFFDERKVQALFDMMSEPSLNRIADAQRTGDLTIGTLYKRGRPAPDGRIRQRAEVRFDGIAGCLRTPAGGSSRQTLLFVKGNSVRARLLNPREAVRLMGLSDSYILPDRYNDAYKIAGDGVLVPIVEYLDRTVFQKALELPAATIAA